MDSLSKPIRLEKWTSVKSALGDWTHTTVRYNCFGQVKRNGGSKVDVNGQTQLKPTVTFRIRFRPDFRPSGDWRVVYDGLRYTVNSIEKENESRFHWLFKCDGTGVQH